MEPGRRALVKEFYANLGERKNLTCYVRGRWIPFGERAISQILGLRQVGSDQSMSSSRRAHVSKKSPKS